MHCVSKNLISNSFRSFSLMNFLKDESRNRMLGEHLCDMMRINQHDDTIETFDVNRATSKYLERHFRCDREDSDTTAQQETAIQNEEVDSCPAPENEGEILGNALIAQIEYEHSYAKLYSPQFEEKSPHDCIALISKASGKALTVVNNVLSVYTFKGDSNQLWYIYDQDFIVSNLHKKVIQRSPLAGHYVSLAKFNHEESRQRWKITGHLLDLELSIDSLNGNLQLSVLDGVKEDGSRVGASRKARDLSQRWTIEKLSSYFPKPDESAVISPVLLHRKPDENEFVIQNRWEGNGLVAMSDDGLFIKRPESDDENVKQLWFRRDHFIVAYNGKVLEASELEQPLTLSFMDDNNPKQKWIFQLVDDGQWYHITSFYNGLVLGCIENPTLSNVVQVGMQLPAYDRKIQRSSMWELILKQDDQEEPMEIDK